MSYNFYINYSHGIINKQITLNQNYILSSTSANLLTILTPKERIELLKKQMEIAPYFRITQQLSDAYKDINDKENAISFAVLTCKMLPYRLAPKQKLMQLYLKFDEIDSAKMVANEILNTPLKIHNSKADSIIANAKNVLNTIR